VIGDYLELLMNGSVEAVANIVLFIITPVALVWVQSRLAMAIEILAKTAS
jgi:hypothetical protein